MLTSTLRNIIWSVFSLFFSVAIGLIIIYVYLNIKLPDVSNLKNIHLQEPLRIYSNDNKLIAEYGQKRRHPITLDQVPPQLINAILATEDQRFLDHSGVDFVGLMRAFINLVQTGTKSQGASTITMQVARNFFLTKEKTYLRKINEVLLAIKIDQEFSKEKILELYLNKIYFGHKAYGVASAAQVYYGKQLSELTLAQIAMLAGLPKAPSKINPLTNPDAALKRRNHVLKRMLEEKHIDQQTFSTTDQEPLSASFHQRKAELYAPYVAEMVREVMHEHLGDNAYTDGFKVYATIDSAKQIAANEALISAVEAYDNRHGYHGPIDRAEKGQKIDFGKYYTPPNCKVGVVLSVDEQNAAVLLSEHQEITLNSESVAWARMQNSKGILGPAPTSPNSVLQENDIIYVMKSEKDTWLLTQVPKVEGALVALDPTNGQIKALVGGYNFSKSNYNRAIQALRQPGSSFKPFIYAAALAKGYNLATIINDAPIVQNDASQDNYLWRPQNHTHHFRGPTPLRQGLARSINLISIRLLQDIGLDFTVPYLTRFGFKENTLPKSLSLALGSTTATPLDMASAYAIFANGGHKIYPHVINRITNANGKEIVLPTPKTACTNCSSQNDSNDTVIDPRIAHLINITLKDAIKSNMRLADQKLNRQDIVGKTGSTNDHVDAWFAGYTPDLVAISWIGFDQPNPIYEYGVKAALPMWTSFMAKALQDHPEQNFKNPPGLIKIRINPKTGKLANSQTPNSYFETFRKEFAPQEQGIIDKQEGYTENYIESLF